MSSSGSPELSKANGLPELTPEQWEAGKEIAELTGIGDDLLGQTMLWNGVAATVEYGLAHSAHHMEYLTVEEILTAVSDGVAAYQAQLGNTNGPT